MKNNRAIKYVIGAWNELKKVSWPSRGMVVYHTIIVLIVAVVAIASTSAIDFGLSALVQKIIENRS